jgi:zinc protease
MSREPLTVQPPPSLMPGAAAGGLARGVAASSGLARRGAVAVSGLARGAARSGLARAVAVAGMAGFAALSGGGAARAQVATVQELHYPPLAPFAIPRPRRVELDNGMVVMLLEDHELPLITVSAQLRAGARLDPPDKLGLGELTGDMMRSSGVTRLPGGGSLSGDQLDDRLEASAATVEVDIGEAAGSALLAAPKEAFASLLPVFAAILREPAFGDDKLALAKTFAKAHLARQNDDVDDLAARELARLIYGGDSPYGRTPTFATLDAVSLADVVAWHRAHVHPENIVLGLVGDFQTADALAAVRAAFGDWRRGAAAAPPAFPYRQQPNPGLFVIDKHDLSQSSVLMGHLGVVRNDPDYFALQVLDEVLSGSFASRLFAHIRTEKGLAYDVQGTVGGDWDHPGLAVLGLSTQVRTTGDGLAALLAEARGLTTAPPTDDEITRAKQSILGSFIFRYDSPAKVIDQQLALELYGYPLDWLDRYHAGIEAVTTDAVRQAAARHLHPDQFTILVVGPDETHDPSLAAFGKVTVLPLPDPAGAAHR